MSAVSNCWLELEEENEDPLFGLPFVVEPGTPLTAGALDELESSDEKDQSEDHCFLGFLTRALDGMKQKNKLVVPPRPKTHNDPQPLFVNHGPMHETDALSCAATSVNSSIEGEEQRREKKRCLLQNGCIQIENFVPIGEELRPATGMAGRKRLDSLPGRNRTNLDYQEYLSARKSR